MDVAILVDIHFLDDGLSFVHKFIPFSFNLVVQNVWIGQEPFVFSFSFLLNLHKS